MDNNIALLKLFRFNLRTKLQRLFPEISSYSQKKITTTERSSLQHCAGQSYSGIGNKFYVYTKN